MIGAKGLSVMTTYNGSCPDMGTWPHDLSIHTSGW